uniref:Uncharacterized protein n=1 Tax=Romanomermis culicivorax TaxID=13658 RepID=A0A915HMN8_ROMCU
MAAERFRITLKTNILVLPQDYDKRYLISSKVGIGLNELSTLGAPQFTCRGLLLQLIVVRAVTRIWIEQPAPRGEWIEPPTPRGEKEKATLS